MQTSFKTTSALFTWKRGQGQSSHHLLCLYHNGFRTINCRGHYWPTGWSAPLLMENASVKLRHLKEAHWNLRGLWHTKLFSASEKEVSKQMFRNYQNTTKDKYFQIKGMSVAYMKVCNVKIWKPHNNPSCHKLKHNRMLVGYRDELV